MLIPENGPDTWAPPPIYRALVGKEPPRAPNGTTPALEADVSTRSESDEDSSDSEALPHLVDFQGRATRADNPNGNGVTVCVRVHFSHSSDGSGNHTVSILPGRDYQTGSIVKSVQQRHASSAEFTVATDLAGDNILARIHIFSNTPLPCMVFRGSPLYSVRVLTKVNFEQMHKNDMFEEGDDDVQIVGIMKEALKVTCRHQSLVAAELVAWSVDWALDGNSVAQFLVKSEYVFASLTLLGLVCSTVDFVREACISAENSNKGNPCQYVLSHVRESFDAGSLTTGLLRLKETEMYETMMSMFIVPYGLIAIPFDWGLSSGFMVFSIFLCANSRAMQTAAISEHFNQPAWRRIVDTKAGERLRRLHRISVSLGWFPTLSLCSSAICNAHMQAHWLMRVVYLSLLVVGSLCAHALMSTITRRAIRRCSDDGTHGRKTARSNPLQALMVSISPLAPLPWHVKLHAASPFLHLFVNIVDVFWKLSILIIVWFLLPGAPEYFRDVFDVGRPIPPVRTVVAYIWLVASVIAELTFVLAFVLAQFTDYFSGLTFHRLPLKDEPPAEGFYYE